MSSRLYVTSVALVIERQLNTFVAPELRRDRGMWRGKILTCLALLDNYFERTAYGACRAHSFAPRAPATVSCLNKIYDVTQ